MNTHLKQLWAAMRLPEKLQKSYKFFCRGLDIRVVKVMYLTDAYHTATQMMDGIYLQRVQQVL